MLPNCFLTLSFTSTFLNHSSYQSSELHLIVCFSNCYSPNYSICICHIHTLNNLRSINLVLCNLHSQSIHHKYHHFIHLTGITFTSFTRCIQSITSSKETWFSLAFSTSESLDFRAFQIVF